MGLTAGFRIAKPCLLFFRTHKPSMLFDPRSLDTSTLSLGVWDSASSLVPLVVRWRQSFSVTMARHLGIWFGTHMSY